MCVKAAGLERCYINTLLLLFVQTLKLKQINRKLSLCYGIKILLNILLYVCVAGSRCRPQSTDVFKLIAVSQPEFVKVQLFQSCLWEQQQSGLHAL